MDILPVKDSEGNFKVLPVSERVDLALLSKLKRCDLEDRHLRLNEENHELKKLIHSQQGKIKKLGAKLLRVLADKKQEMTVQAQGPLMDDIRHLQHENYSLKDKNTVLRQQLASYDHHQTVSNGNQGSELEDAHTEALTRQNKALTEQLQALQTEMRRLVEGRVEENVEVIRLRRQMRQLEGALRSAHQNLPLLQQQNARLQAENEEALQIVAEKQSQVIDCQGSLDMAAKSRLELAELAQTVEDLRGERDILKARCDILLQTVQQVEKQVAEKSVPAPAVVCTRPCRNQISAWTQTSVESAETEECIATYDVMQLLSRNRSSENDDEKPTAVTAQESLRRTPQPKPSDEDRREWKEAVAAERSALVRDMHCLREMMTGESERCQHLENQLRRKQDEVEMASLRHRDVLQQRDLFLSLLTNRVVSEEGEGVVTTAGGTYTKNSPVKFASPLTTSVEPRPRERPNTSDATVEPVPQPSVPRQLQVSILWLQLDENGKVLGDDCCVALYVDFTLLGTTRTEFETPQALPKPTLPQEKCYYNYTVDVEWSEELRDRMTDGGEDGVVFNVVSEPPMIAATDTTLDDSHVECTVQGSCNIRLEELTGSQTEHLLPILDEDKQQQGVLAVAAHWVTPPQAM